MTKSTRTEEPEEGPPEFPTTVLLRAVGEAAMVHHNERLADPLDEITRAISAITAIRKKTEAQHIEIARLEFLGGLYLSGPAKLKEGHLIPEDGAVPTFPAWNVLRCLQVGASRHKRGPDVLRGVRPLVESSTLIYDGPTDPNEMWRTGEFALRKTVGVQRNRLVRTRPIFWPWTITVPVNVDPVIFDIDTLAVMWRDAGRYAGLGEMRPVYGCFTGTIEPYES